MILIGIDQGTTNTKAIALDSSGKILAEASRPLATHAPEPGAVEQDPDAMVANVQGCVRDVLAATRHEAGEVAGLGIANQTETLVVWDRRTGKPAMPAMVWQCRRGAAEIAPLQASNLSSLIKTRTGLDLDPTFTASKLKWLSHHRPAIADGLRKGDLYFGTVDTWLIWKLTAGAVYATEPSNASRTMLYDIDRLSWDRDLLSAFSLDIDRLPECRLSNARFGETDPSFFGKPIPITGVMGDQQASLFGHGCFDEMQAKVTYGTGAFLWVNAGSGARDAPAGGIIRTIAWQIGEPCYAYEGFVMYAGKILEWLAQRLAVPGGAPGIAAAAEKAGSAGGVLLVPAFQGLASPWWQNAVRAALMGLSETTTNGHIAHAGLEAVCYQIRAVLEAMERHRGKTIPMIKVDGGMTRSKYFLQLQSDVLRRALSPASSDAMTPLGAALMAGLGSGVWNTLDQLRQIAGVTTPITPNEAAAASLDRTYADWLRSIEMLVGLNGALMTTGEDKIYDLLVIGGGINGAAIACDAAGRGLTVALVEMYDFGEGTSSRSSKLIHGGLRYLETYDFKLVRDALIEREILMHKAPHLVWPLRLILPHVESQRPRWIIRLGLFIYDNLARRKVLEGSRSIDLSTHPAGSALKSQYRHAFAYSDCRGDDSRLVIANLLAAQRHGADILCRHRFESAERGHGVWNITLRDIRRERTFNVRSRVLINAAGPWVIDVTRRIAGATTTRRLRLVRGSHIVVPRQWEGEHGYFLQTGDGRLMEAFPYEGDFTSIGTTDEPWDDAPEKVTISEGEIAYMLAEVNAFLKKPVTRDQIVWSYSGVRPLFEVGGGRDGDLSTLTRDYAFEIDGDAEKAPLLTIFGGKLTTHRRLAEHALKELSQIMPWPKEGVTRTEILPGGDFGAAGPSGYRQALAARYPWLPQSQIERYVRQFGTRSDDLLAGAGGHEDLGSHIGAGLYRREVDFLIRTEWAVTADDVIWRRTKTGLRLSPDEALRLAAYMESPMEDLSRRSE